MTLLCATMTVTAAPALPPVHHVFVLVLENESYVATFGNSAGQSYLTHTLPSKGALLANYYAIGHYSLPNYIALISGQAPNDATQMDCPRFSEFHPSAETLDAHGQLPGVGCVYPTSLQTLPDQLRAKSLSWRGYMEDMGSNPQRDHSTCAHPFIGSADMTEAAEVNDQYATRHDPFVYFHSLIDHQARCDESVVNLSLLAHDLERVQTTPNFVFITPNLCNDGHDSPCVDGRRGGLEAIDKFLQEWIPRITESAAFKADGLLVVTFDESGTVDAKGSMSCCDERGLAGARNPPGLAGPGGGRIGAVVISPFVRPGTVSSGDYNHYALLATVESLFGLTHLGYAADSGVKTFGPDVFTAW